MSVCISPSCFCISFPHIHTRSLPCQMCAHALLLRLRIVSSCLSVYLPAACSFQSGNKVVTSLCTPLSGSTIISGHPDHVLRLWDTRASGPAASTSTSSVKSTFTGHKSWVSAVAWAPDSSYHVASASHDGAVLMWDIRSSTPLHALGAHDDKALAVAFVGATHVVSGTCPVLVLPLTSTCS